MRPLNLGDGMQSVPRPPQLRPASSSPVQRFTEAFRATKAHDAARDERFLLATKAMTEVIGTKHIEDIKRADLRAVGDLISRLPAHTNKRFPGKTILHVAEYRDLHGYPIMSARSREKHVMAVSQIWA